MIAAKVAQRARARLPARAAGGDRRLRRLHRRDRGATRARPARTSCWSCPRGGKIRAQDAAVQARARASWSRSRTQTRCGSPTRCGCWLRRVRGSARRLRLRPGPLRAGPRAPGGSRPPTRRASTGATSWRCARWSRACRSITAGNGAIYATRRDGLHGRRPDHGPRPVVSVQHGQARPACGLRARRRARASKMVPSIEGEFARKRRMMSHTWPIVLRGGMLSPRGYPPGYALMILSHRVLRYATPLSARRGAARERRAGRDRRPGHGRCMWSTLALQLALLRGGRRWRRRADSPAAGGALLRADHGVARRSGCGTGCVTARTLAGRRRKGRVRAGRAAEGTP